MQTEAQQLEAFYDGPVGQVARRLVLQRVRMAWPDLGGQRVLGYGFAAPYLRSLGGDCERAVALAPAHLGAVRWPQQRSLTALGEEDAMPFADSTFDRILIVHGLETADAFRPLMRQIWRVLTPAGRVLIIVPNRASLWAQVLRSPFAQGRPFHRGELDRLLRDTMFTPERWDSALYLPPLKSRRLIGTGRNWERMGRALWPRLGGVHLVEASKSLYGIAPPEKTARKKFVLAPQP
jgi:SAM-dependent methyltransferase